VAAGSVLSTLQITSWSIPTEQRIQGFKSRKLTTFER